MISDTATAKDGDDHAAPPARCHPAEGATRAADAVRATGIPVCAARLLRTAGVPTRTAGVCYPATAEVAGTADRRRVRRGRPGAGRRRCHGGAAHPAGARIRRGHADPGDVGAGHDPGHGADHAGRVHRRPADLLLTKPAGTTPLSHEGAADGTMSLTEAAAPYADSAQVAKELGDLEYQQGAVTAWQDTKLRDVYVTLYQFRYAREAAQFSVEVQRGLQNNSATDSSASFDEIAGGRWFAEKKEPGNKTPVHAVFIKGNIMVDITVYANTSADIDFTKKTAIDQYARLP
jgi:hypothetical protein